MNPQSFRFLPSFQQKLSCRQYQKWGVLWQGRFELVLLTVGITNAMVHFLVKIGWECSRRFSASFLPRSNNVEHTCKCLCLWDAASTRGSQYYWKCRCYKVCKKAYSHTCFVQNPISYLITSDSMWHINKQSPDTLTLKLKWWLTPCFPWTPWYRSSPDNEGGYTWSITFTSDENAGHVPNLMGDASQLTGMSKT